MVLDNPEIIIVLIIINDLKGYKFSKNKLDCWMILKEWKSFVLNRKDRLAQESKYKRINNDKFLEKLIGDM